jgi:oligoendopeptidase F
MEYLLGKTEDKKERAYLINHFLEQFRTTLYRQTMFAEFEMITHQKSLEGEALTADTLCKIYRDLNIAYFGDDIVIDSEIDMEWARIPHFYNAFYVYQYATGYSAAIALSRKILKEGEPAVNDYINKFLSGGGSDYPIELLKKAGVDMSTKEPVQQALDLFGKLLDEMEELMK